MSIIDSLVSQFVVELRRAIAAEAAAAFASVAGAEEAGNGRRRGRKSEPKPKVKSAPKGGKRTSEEIEAQTKTLLAQIKKTPGKNIEALASATGVSSKDLALPVLKLWDSKLIRTTGQKRGTRYFPK